MLGWSEDESVPIILVGHSFGVYPATVCAKHYQESSGRRVCHIFSICGIAREQLLLHELYNRSSVEGLSNEELAQLIKAFTMAMNGNKPAGLLSDSFDALKYVVEG